MSKFCKNCRWWNGVIFMRVDQEFGLCSHPVAAICMVQDSAAKLNEDGPVYTSSRFGCVYLEPEPKILIKIKTINHDQEFKQSL